MEIPKFEERYLKYVVAGYSQEKMAKLFKISVRTLQRMIAETREQPMVEAESMTKVNGYITEERLLMMLKQRDLMLKQTESRLQQQIDELRALLKQTIDAL